MDGTTFTQLAFVNETQVNKVLAGTSLVPAAAKKALKEQAALIRMMCAALDALRLEKQGV